MATTDKNGREILPGDTIKMFHFADGRKKHYMYKYVKEVVQKGTGHFFNVRHLDLKDTGFMLLVDDKQHDDIEIVQGFGSDGTPFEKRTRHRRGCTP